MIWVLSPPFTHLKRFIPQVSQLWPHLQNQQNSQGPQVESFVMIFYVSATLSSSPQLFKQ
jgi:hypothetical protein